MDSYFGSGHEQVVFCREARSGLRAIIAIYSTALGPALGGTRFHPYDSEDEALADVLNLSRGMAYKNALAGLDFGGGKAVIIGDPAADRSEALLRAYGRFVQALGGRYVTACDVGTTPADMDLIARECDHVGGGTVERGGTGESAVLTSFGVIQGMYAAAEHAWGLRRLWSRRIGIQGVGSVGMRLATQLADEGATVVAYDTDPAALSRLTEAVPGAQVVSSLDALLRADLDIFAPCAMGGVLDERAVALLSARIVCGAANNQLADDGVAKLLDERGILYAPDYVVNAGGAIMIADELAGYDPARARARAAGIYETTRQVLRRAQHDGVRPDQAADRIAEARMASVSSLRSLHLPAAS